MSQYQLGTVSMSHVIRFHIFFLLLLYTYTYNWSIHSIILFGILVKTVGILHPLVNNAVLALLIPSNFDIEWVEETTFGQSIVGVLVHQDALSMLTGENTYSK